MVRDYGNMRADLVFSQEMVCQKCSPTGCNKCKNNVMCRDDVFSFLSLSCLESG